jgi:nanoRNase/pAp phosphatase (c-di-AMP/oligoRNAs hydrolase)
MNSQKIGGQKMSPEKKKYRLVTRSDMDGLVCAVLIKELGMLSTIKFVHPKDVQDGKVDLGPGDITTNLPYVESVHLAFDHHASETLRVEEQQDNHIIDPDAPSAARVVYKYFGGEETFPNLSQEMLHAVDKADSAQYTEQDILNPQGWELLSFMMDARTGLGRFRDFRISNYDLMMDLIDYCRDHTIEDILNMPDVQERTDLYFEHAGAFKEQIKRCSTRYGNLVVLDLRDEEIIYSGNRFMIYALNPGCTISMHVLWGLKKQNTSFAVGKSIIDRSSQVHIGELMLKYGGGGHVAAGTCQIDNDEAGQVKEELIEVLSK